MLWYLLPDRLHGWMTTTSTSLWLPSDLHCYFFSRALISLSWNQVLCADVVEHHPNGFGWQNMHIIKEKWFLRQLYISHKILKGGNKSEIVKEHGITLHSQLNYTSQSKGTMTTFFQQTKRIRRKFCTWFLKHLISRDVELPPPPLSLSTRLRRSNS